MLFFQGWSIEDLALALQELHFYLIKNSRIDVDIYLRRLFHIQEYRKVCYLSIFFFLLEFYLVALPQFYENFPLCDFIISYYIYLIKFHLFKRKGMLMMVFD